VIGAKRMKKFRLSFVIVVAGIVISSLVGCSNLQKMKDSPSNSDEVKLKQTDAENQGNDSPGKTALPSTDAEKEIEYKENLCTESEETLFSFKLADSSKTLSVCVSKEQQDYIVYRLGSKDKIELEFPKNKADSWSKFTYSYYLRGGGAENEGMDLNYLSFEDDGYEYEIYQEFTAKDNMTSVGIKITDKATNKITDIKGLNNTVEGSLINLRENEKIKTEIP
jgi:hypothetical protein